MKKRCCTCKEDKDLSEFGNLAKSSDGLEYKCKSCKRDYDNNHYQRNKSKHRKKAKEWQNRQSEWWYGFKSTLKCNRCSEDHPACLQFHHTDPNEKEHVLGDMVRTHSKEKVLAEVEKCEVLCANCHMKEHFTKYHK